ncbi:hypothetical protein PMAYCL1PPCAC_22116, partial [Pristionchus mayeri]
NCNFGMHFMNGWCYAFAKAPPDSNLQAAGKYCEDRYDAYLPSISSDEDLNNLMHIRRYYLGADTTNLFIGLQCENQKWSWTNGESWTGWNEFIGGEDVNSCANVFNAAYMFNSVGKWISVDAEHAEAQYIVCAARRMTFRTTGIPERCPRNSWELSYGKCISISAQQYLTFDKDVLYCEIRGASLPSIASSEENAAYANLLNSVVGLSSFWLGLECKEGKWAWLDGTPFNYSNFIDPFYSNFYECLDDIAFAFELDGGWNGINKSESMKIGLCVAPADESIPTPLPAICEGGWLSIDGACFYFDGSQRKKSYYNARDYCKGLSANLPSIISRDQNERILLSAQQLINALTTSQFWLGLECKDGDFVWEDGSPYIYSNLPAIFSSCDSRMGYTFTNDGTWAQLVKDAGETMFIACSKSSMMTVLTTGTTTSTTEMSTSKTATTTTSTIDSATTTSRLGSGGLPIWAIVLICLGVLLIIGCFLAVVYFAKKRIHRLEAEIVEIERHESRTNSNKMINSVAESRPAPRYYNLPSRCDEWEIERKFVSIDYTNKLGEGAFGSVYLGRVLAKNIPPAAGKSIVELTALRSDNDAVAVKMLHEFADSSAEREFRDEIDLMKKIGYHERLVNLLACVTQSEPILLITEFCSNGDLLEFLRKRRKYMLENTPEYYNQKDIITAKQQIMFAIQVAYGLEYLSTRGFVHRDIAARNIMVDQQETCKIGDFGLCRMVENENENYHAQGGKLPLKWMSPEAIDKYFFSITSDVWSYGILLFEIVTLGGTPYPGWPAAELLSRLKNGDRMERPDNCSEELYEVMLHCWAENPSDRPTFTQLRKRLGVLLEDVNQDDYYLQLNAQANYYVFESNGI